MAERAAHRGARPERLGLEARMLAAALWRRRGVVALAIAALAIGTSVASALLHVSHDVSRKVSRELRALGPNLLLVPRPAAGVAPAAGYLDVAMARARLARAGIEGAPLLYLVASEQGRPIQVVGADLEALRRLHPSWRIEAAPGVAPASGPPSIIGRRLMERLAVAPGRRVSLAMSGGTATLDLTVSDVLIAGATPGAASMRHEGWRRRSASRSAPTTWIGRPCSLATR